MTRQDYFHKWFAYSLGLLPIWLLDCYLLCRYPVYGTTPMLLPLTVAAVATMEGQMSGGIFGMWVGFLWETTYPGGFGAMIFLLTIFGFLGGTGVQYVLKRGYFGFFVCSLFTLLGVEFMIVLAHSLSGTATYLYLIPLASRQIALTMCYSPLVYWVFRRVFSKVGGNKLA
ncbi:MAG: rod shape-determining protein MreD [Eubacteriales bacterium]